MGKVWVIVVVVAAGLLAALLVSQRGVPPFVVSGFIEADEIRVGSLVGGRVARVLVEEGSAVKPGDVLVELEPFELLDQKSQAEAELARERAELERLRAGFRVEEIAQAKARHDRLVAEHAKLVQGARKQELEVAEAELSHSGAELSLAELESSRLEKLVAEDIATQELLDETKTRQHVALARHQAAQARLNLLKEGTRVEDLDAAKAEEQEAFHAWQLLVNGTRVEDIRAQEAAVQSAEAELKAIEQRLRELQVRATVSGAVEAVELQQGDLVAPQAPVVSLMDTRRFWVRAYVPEDRLHLKLGDEATVSVDSYPGMSFKARVTFVSRNAEFTPSNVQTPEERSKQVFRIKVELEEGLDRLRPGMAADVHLQEPPRE